MKDAQGHTREGVRFGRQRGRASRLTVPSQAQKKLYWRGTSKVLVGAKSFSSSPGPCHRPYNHTSYTPGSRPLTLKPKVLIAAPHPEWLRGRHSADVDAPHENLRVGNNQSIGCLNMRALTVSFLESLGL